jgi:ATP-dependent exoDNAse (exonuclease V) beta subunit
MDFEILEKLNGFNHIKFEERRHLYTIGDRKLTSVTTLLKGLEPEKDWGEIAFKYSLKHGETTEYWIEKWKQEGIMGSEKGSEFHLYAENSLANKVYLPNEIKLGQVQDKCKMLDIDIRRALKKMMMMWDVFWLQASPNLVPVRSEFIIGDEDFGIGGMIDQLFWNIKMMELQIWDWKTNKAIKTANRYQSFLNPISHLDECEFNKYSLQIGIYKYILEKNLGLEIGNCYIGHFHENNDTYKILKTRGMEKEVQLILNAA